VALVAASALGAATLAGAVAYDPAKVVAVRSLGEGAELHFVESFDWRARRFHPFVVAGGRSRRAGPATFALPAVLVHRASGRAMVPGGDGTWRIVERDSRPVEVAPAAGEPGPEPAGIVGWSPGGDRFAWRLGGDLGRREPAVLVAGLDGATRSLPLAEMKLVLEPNWNAIWLDDDRLLVASDWTGVALDGGWPGAPGGDDRAGARRRLNWRAVLDAAAGGGLDRQRLPLGWRLETPGPVLGLPFAPAAYSDDVLALPPPRRGRAPLGWLTDGRVSRLIELTAGALPEPLWETDAAIRDTLGVLAGDEAVWVERRPGGTEVVRLVAGEEAPRGACVFSADRRPWIFRGAAGRWALWAERGEDGGPGDRLLGCELDRGITRVLDGLGPLGWLSADVVAGGLVAPGRWRIDLPEIGAEIGAERGAEAGP
jgi:hypothetical protein